MTINQEIISALFSHHLNPTKINFFKNIVVVEKIGFLLLLESDELFNVPSETQGL